MTSPFTHFTHLTCGLIVAAALLASSESNAAPDTYLDEIVVTAVKSSANIRETSASVSLLDTNTLSRVSHTHINEVMHRAAGVWISRGNGQEHLTAIRSPVLTGAGSCGAFLMAQDGVSLRAPGFCNVNELFESTSELASRIEVIKGPGSAIHGTNALHGTVNILTPEPVAGLKKIRFEAGPYDYYRSRVTLSSSATRIDVTGTTDGGYKDESGFDQQKLLAKHRWDSGDRTVTGTFSYTNLNQETAGFIRGDEVYKQTGSKRDNPNPEAFRDARSYRLVFDINQPLERGELKIKPYLRSVDMTFLQHFLPGQPLEENGHDSLGLQTLWTHADGNWRAGLELEYTDGFLRETQAGPTSGSAFLVATIPTGKHYDYDVTARLAGFFTQYDASPTDNLTLSAGLRYQHVSYDYNNRMISGRTRDDGTSCGFGGCRFNRPDDRKDTFNHVSPRIGFIYDVTDDHQIYGSLSQGFRAPQATELYRLQAGQSVADIDPVELDALELGTRGSNGSLSYDLTVFAMKKDNFIFRDTNRQNVDNGRTRHRGIELSLDWQMNSQLRAALSFTRADHEYDNNPALSVTPVKGNAIDTAPETLGSARLYWQAATNASLELEWVHVGSYWEDPQNLNKYEGHDLLHLRGEWRVSSKLFLSIRLMNASDRDYAERADFAFGSDRYFVGTPRSLFIGLELNL